MTKSNTSKAVLDRFPLDKGVQEEVEKFFELVRNAKRILISSTLTSDGDSIGAQIGICKLIEGFRKLNPPEIHIVNQSPVPQRYRFLSETSRIWTLEEWESKKEASSYDLGITCDGGVERTGSVARLFEGIPNVVLVDHHLVGSELEYASKILDIKSSSTCEIVYELFEYAGISLTPAVAEHLYIGIVFDTGFFKHSITTPRTHHVAAELISTGIDFSNIADRALLERSWGGQLLLQKMMANMSSQMDGRFIYSFWTSSDLSNIPHEDGDQEGMINQLYFTENCEIVALFVELSESKTKISFRSKSDFNVAEFARLLNPAGGGHKKASGCTLDQPLREALKLVSQKLTEINR